MYTKYLAIAATGALAACGGGTSSLPGAITGPEVNAIAQDQTLGVERISLPTSQTYAELFEDSGTGQVIIEGVGAYTPANVPAGAPEYGEYVYGVRDLSNGNILITDTKTQFLDNDGLTTAGGASYYGSSLASQYLGTGAREAIDQSAYDYVRIGSARLGDNSVFDLVFGVSTAPGDVPTTGSADYLTGDALLILSSGVSGIPDDGTASASADFASGTVDLSAMAGSNLSSTFTEVRATGLSIDGNTFSGGAVTLRDGSGNDITASVLGTVSADEAAGMFYGPGADELGAYILSQGSTASVNVYLVAEE